MLERRETRDGPVRQALAWVGLVLMLVSAIWWQFLPRGPRFGRPGEGELGGPVTRVIIDAGHGGLDSGVMRAGLLEKDLTLDVARRLEQLVRAQGLATTLTRTGDETVSLSSRAAAANRERDSVFVSIHFDEGARAAATGVQTFYATRQVPKTRLATAWLPFLQRVSSGPNNLESQSLAGFVQEELVARTGAVDRGTRAEQFFVVAHVRHPAVLVEGGFLSNDEDVARLKTEEYRQQLAVAISDGIIRYRQIAEQTRAARANDGPGI